MGPITAAPICALDVIDVHKAARILEHSILTAPLLFSLFVLPSYDT